MSLTEALLKWTSSSFDLDPSVDPKSFSDGVKCAKILHKIDSNHFTQKWIATVKADIPSENVRLKSNNVKKVLNAIMEYYSEVLSLHMTDFPTPDVNKVAEGNSGDTGRLLQLILGCAINCDEKQHYIQSIMIMEESVQQVIMQAIQELMNLQVSNPEPSLQGLNSIEVRKLMDDLREANLEREELKQKCHDFENRVNLIEDEKSNLTAEVEQLQKRLLGSDTTRSKDDSGILSQELKKQVESLQEELYKSEGQRDELQVKVEVLERQAEESQSREAELQKLADQALKLKDEVDILRETADKATKFEAAIEAYKKKLEDLGDLRRQLKILEDKNTEYMQRNMELEEDVKKTGSWKPQVDTYKKQLSELRAKVDSESKKSDRLEFETKKLLEKVEALSVERDRLQSEKEELRERHDELVDDIKFGQATKGSKDGTGLDDENDPGMLEMIPSSIKERLLRLQHENKRLKSALGGQHAGSQHSHPELLQTMVDDLKEREKSLEAENRKAHQKIMELESKLEEAGGGSAVPPRVPGSREELELKLAEAGKKVSQLQDTLQRKEVEMSGMEERYKKYIEKAKSVIKTLDPKSGSAGAGGGGPEVAVLRSQLSEKDRLIETLEHETEKARAVREMEERLLSSAFYNLSMQMHRSAVENRLGNSHGGNAPNQVAAAVAGSGQSFLARQRQVNNNGGTRGGGKGAYNSSDFLEYQ